MILPTILWAAWYGHLVWIVAYYTDEWLGGRWPRWQVVRAT